MVYRTCNPADNIMDVANMVHLCPRDRAFLVAAQQNNERGVMRLLDEGANILAADSFGFNAAYHLAYHDNGAAVMRLAERDVGVLDQAAIFSRTPLHMLAKNGNAEAVKALATLHPRALLHTDMFRQTPASFLANFHAGDVIVALADINPGIKQQASILREAITSMVMSLIQIRRLVDAGFAVPDDVDSCLKKAHLTRGDVALL